jgi:hypothetical protein
VRKNPAEKTHIKRPSFSENVFCKLINNTYEPTDLCIFTYEPFHIELVNSSVFFISSCSDPQEKRADMEKGFLDLSSWDFDEDGLVNLNGPWEFYWEQLLDSGDFELNDSITKKHKCRHHSVLKLLTGTC